MGRFYAISVGSNTWNSQINGTDNPGALNVEFDILESFAGLPMGASTVTIEGVSLQDLQQAPQFAGQTLTMRAGMSAGFPLANPAQAGLILQGGVLQSFGNWIGTSMTLDFVVQVPRYTMANPGNFVLDWKAGTSLQSALQTTLSIAYPNVTIVFQIGSYVNSFDVMGAYSTISNLAKLVKSITKSASSPGVDIVFRNTGNKIVVVDGSTTVSSSAIQLQFTDLIGQPTWIDKGVMQFTTVLRADIGVTSFVQMPQGLQSVPGIVTTTAASFPSQFKYETSFQGKFLVTSVRHIGNFRDAQGTAWMSVFQCVPQS